MVPREKKLFLVLELKDFLRLFRIFPPTLAAGPDISPFFLGLVVSPS